MERNTTPGSKSNLQPKSSNTPPQNEERIDNGQKFPKDDAAAENSLKTTDGGNRGSAKNDPITRYTFWLMVFTGLLVACNVALWLSTKKAADSAARSVETAIDTKERQLRAYVYARPNNAYNVDKDKQVVGHTTVGNFGSTVANNIRIYAGIRVMKKPGPDAIDDISDWMEQEEGSGTISPAESREIVRIDTAIINDEIIKAINKKDIGIYIFGRITYEDVFGHQHKTEFCHMYIGEYGSLIMGNKYRGYLAPYAKYCNKHNYAD